MPFHILIVEDEELYADQLEMMVEQLGHHHTIIGNSNDVLARITEVRPDLILMDVHIDGDHDGIELAEIVRKERKIPVIFITSLRDDLTFRRASRIGPVNFLLKPFDKLQLQRSIELAVRQTSKENSSTTNSDAKIADGTVSDEAFSSIEKNEGLFNDHFFVKNRGRLEKVALNDVLYLEADGHYCLIHTTARKHLVHQSLAAMSSRLPDNFVTTHRSFLVNLQKVTGIDTQESTIRLIDREVPLSRRNKEEILRRLDWI